jgi:hypothetical protein
MEVFPYLSSAYLAERGLAGPGVASGLVDGWVMLV